MQLDLLIRNGLVVDGTGAPAFTADVGIAGGRIAYVGVLPEGISAHREIDATGKVVSPGFLDIHSHSDFVLADPAHEDILGCFLRQGITTLVTGNCGFAPAPANAEFGAEMRDYTSFLRSRGSVTDWPTMGAYLDTLTDQGVALNVVPLAAHGALRIATMGFAKREPDAAELRQMGKLLDEALDAGVYGMSAGLAYAPGMYAGTAEITRLATSVGRRDGLFTCHSRGLSETLVDAVSEVVDVAAHGDVRTQFSHLCALGEANWPRIGRAIDTLESARSRGVDIATDCQAYIAGNTTLSALLPPWALEGGMDAVVERLADAGTRGLIRHAIEHERPQWPTGAGGWTDNMIASLGYDNILLLTIGSNRFKDFEGMSLAGFAAGIGKDPFDATMELVVADRGETMMLVVGSAGSMRSDAPLREVLRLPYTALETDAIVTGEGKPNRGAMGAYPRMLGHFVRDEGLLSLEQAVYQMTGLAADRIGISDAGRLRAGCAADVVVFDLAEIADTTTYLDTMSAPRGVEYVLVNGTAVVDQGRYRPSRAGRVYRRS
ncbi:amidohydrolase family protein [Amycolatopsis acidiphila]|uniref:Amidohydrolase family protein n=1 Tax=Amycolatopsis acidiphila TaxID=715473 RepID=A0A558AJ09_9PSEU|nr:amidohydrolase family protein [Amycolatopsis acidiphila]TVT24253.1 amidohydrolase family protein [Amycolatopsis acidiphila]UIJ62616.1 amidohydrolase family protein [Amycolatopsis acidiphila]GHG85784.1 dihydroorotase [Amycolatopsis acidiphila]